MMSDIKLSSQEKLNIIQEIMEEIRTKTGIMAIQSDDVLSGRPDTSTQHTYQIANGEISKKTQTSFLQQKILQAQLASIKAEECLKV